VSDRPKQDLREISHLFLSGIREKQTGGAPRPHRIGPGQRAELPVEITPEELEQVRAASKPDVESEGVANITAVLASHFDDRQVERVRQFAAHLAQTVGRVGLIEADANELKLSVFQLTDGDPAGNVSRDATPTATEARQIGESLEELSWDIDRWLISFGGNTRAPEVRELLRRVGEFVLLSSCEPDGIVAAYRTLKGTADVVRRDRRPALTLALFEAADASHAACTFEKMNGVGVQFLNWPVDREMVIESAESVQDHAVLLYRSGADRGGAAHWKAVSEFIDQRAAPRRSEPAVEARPSVASFDSMKLKSPSEAKMTINTVTAADDAEEIVELTGGDDANSVLAAVITGAPQQWIECPVRAPMCDEARLVVSRDRSLTLLAVAKKGLSDLRSIGQAYQWLSQNRSLIAMALPQLAIDAHQLPRLQLLIDHADASADVLQPMLHSGHVAVTAYRKVRFSGRRGLLLEAA
jgi:hypothetical protein